MRALIASIHDVGPKFETQVDRLLDRVQRHVPQQRLTMLIVPNHWGEAPLVPGSPFATRLRGWADCGMDMMLHGWFHRDGAVHADPLSRFKARHMTAGEGEFLALDTPTAAQRLRDGRALVEGIIGRPVAGFIAPAWLCGPAAFQAVRDAGFDLTEDHFTVSRPATGQVLARGPVITWASRARRVASRLTARILPSLLRAAPVVRLAVHPGDAAVPSLLNSIDLCLARLSRRRQAIRYSDLMPCAS